MAAVIAAAGVAVSSSLDPELVEKLIKGARAAPISFAFGLGATPDKSVMAADKLKAGKVLFELCRKEGGAKKGAFGAVLLGDGGAVFTCEKDDIPSLDKAIQAYFKAHRLNLRVGEVVAAGEEQEEAADEEGPAPSEPPPADDGNGGEGEVPEGKVYDPATIVALIRKAHTRAYPFAFGLAGERPLLAVHPRLDPARLAQMVRSEGVRRGIWGAVQLDGSTAVFTCEKEPYAGAKRQLLGLFKEWKFSARVKILGPDGAEDGEAEAEEAGDDTPAGDAAALRAELNALLPRLKVLARDPDLAPKIKAAWSNADAAVKGGDAETAARGMAELRQILAASPASPPADALGSAAQAWGMAITEATDSIGRMKAHILATFARDASQQDQVTAAIKRLDDALARLRGDMEAKLAGLAAGKAEPSAIWQEAKAIHAFIKSDELMAVIDSGSVLPGLKVAAPVLAVLDTIGRLTKAA